MNPFPQSSMPLLKRGSQTKKSGSRKTLASQSETALQIEVVKLFRERLKNTVWFHVPNGERRSPLTAVKLRGMGVRPGVADFILLCQGIAIAIELKTEKGAQSVNQTSFMHAWRKAGGEYAICRSLDHVITLINANRLD
jgi:hypothetical protein